MDAQLFPPELLAAPLRRSLAPERTPGNLFQGIHRSNQCGPGMEFQEYKPYVQGDELRHVDWKVFQRTRQLLVRHFRQDPRLKHRIVLDNSPSIRFKQSRHQAAWRTAALLGGAMLAAGDAFVLKITGNSQEFSFHPGGHEAFMDYLECLSKTFHEPGRNGNLFDHLPCSQRVWIISDFLDPQGLQNLERNLRKAGPFTPLRIEEQEELNPTVGQEYRLQDVESGEEILWSADQVSCDTYIQRLNLLLRLLQTAAAQANSICYRIDADADIRSLIAACMGEGEVKQC